LASPMKVPRILAIEMARSEPYCGAVRPCILEPRLAKTNSGAL